MAGERFEDGLGADGVIQHCAINATKECKTQCTIESPQSQKATLFSHCKTPRQRRNHPQQFSKIKVTLTIIAGSFQKPWNDRYEVFQRRVCVCGRRLYTFTIGCVAQNLERGRLVVDSILVGWIS